jgi:hypothetical protein
MTDASSEASVALLNHCDLYHVFLNAMDVDAAMGELTERLGVGWLPVMSGSYCAWVAGQAPETGEAVTVYSSRGPVYIELGHFDVECMPTVTDLFNPHHFGYWCDDVAETSRALQDSGWIAEFEVGRLEDGPTASYLRSTAGLRVELVPRNIKSRFDEYAAQA